MEPVSEALQLLQRREELESATRAPGGIRITEERELYQLRAQLSRYPHAVRAVLEAARSPAFRWAFERGDPVASPKGH